MSFGRKSFKLDVYQIRKRFPEQYVDIFDDFLISLKESGELDKLAKQWFRFSRVRVDETQTNGKELVEKALDVLLRPMPTNPKINNFEITLEIETGNLINRKFQDLEELLDFITQNADDPKKILDEISPKIKSKGIQEQMGFYETEDDQDF